MILIKYYHLKIKINNLYFINSTYTRRICANFFDGLLLGLLNHNRRWLALTGCHGLLEAHMLRGISTLFTALLILLVGLRIHRRFRRLIIIIYEL